jgi:hypothetical protein
MLPNRCEEQGHLPFRQPTHVRSVPFGTARITGIAGIGQNHEVTLYESLPSTRPYRHLRNEELQWFDFDPEPFAEFVRRMARDARHHDLADRLAKVRKAAWRCQSTLVFHPAPKPGAIQWTDCVSDSNEELGIFDELCIDVDREGNPLGIEFTDIVCDAS